MPAAIAPAADPATTSPWRTVAVAAALLAVQVVLLDRLVGEQILTIPEAFGDGRWLRKDVLLAVLAAGGLLAAHARGHLEAYRRAPLPLVGLICEAGAFLALFAFLVAMRRGAPQAAFGLAAARWIAAALVGGWLATILRLLPRGANALPAALAAAAAGAFVLAAIRLGETVAETFWYVTGDSTVWLVERLVAPFAGAPVVRPAPLVIGTAAFNVYIGAGCSGYQGISLITMLFAGYLWWFRRLHRFPQSLLLFPVGITLIFLSNAVRIAALLLVGIWISPTIAVDGFHSQAGWIMFLLVGLGLIWATSRMPFFTVMPVGDDVAAPAPDPRFAMLAGGTPATAARHAVAGASSAAGSGAAVPTVSAEFCGPSVPACLAPFLALLATTIVAGAFSTKDGIDILYPLRVVTVAAVLWYHRHEFRWREATLSPVAVATGGATCLVWMLLAPAITLPDPEAAARQDPAQLGILGGGAWLLCRLIGYTITVPIAEELAFRGFLARRLIAEQVEQVPVGTFTWVSFLGSSLAFGLLHGADWLPATLAGMAFALALLHRRQLVDAIVAHATTNALIGFYAIATGSWASLG